MANSSTFWLNTLYYFSKRHKWWLDLLGLGILKYKVEIFGIKQQQKEVRCTRHAFCKNSQTTFSYVQQQVVSHPPLLFYFTKDASSKSGLVIQTSIWSGYGRRQTLKRLSFYCQNCLATPKSWPTNYSILCILWVLYVNHQWPNSWHLHCMPITYWLILNWYFLFVWWAINWYSLRFLSYCCRRRRVNQAWSLSIMTDWPVPIIIVVRPVSLKTLIIARGKWHADISSSKPNSIVNTVRTEVIAFKNR